ncbi:hypothetical protein O0235_09495 [Tepidiforma flava]|uniref:Uncharacterized protein n=1 Tax=Tepidiforma flava TaxID=3004094 RepID=A0ABY7M4U3_9CHLR|nr:hypothetical protein [Tepidiforma flava]WBL35020.1 hypothetical protein O0235_09495 [Tepidiforma flava]
MDGAIPYAGFDAEPADGGDAPDLELDESRWLVDAYLSGGLRKLASYDGFIVEPASASDLGTQISMPLAIKLDGFYTPVPAFEPKNPTAATATITYVGNTGTYTVNLNIPANGTASHSVYETVGGIPEGFVGAATITSSQPIAAVLFRSKMTAPGSFVDEDLYTAVNGIPVNKATTTAKLPLIFRRAYKTGSFSGYNTWVSVSVADGGTANVTITAINDTSNTAPGCNAPGTYTTTKTITGSFIFYQNAETDTGLGPTSAGLLLGRHDDHVGPADRGHRERWTNDLNQGDNGRPVQRFQQLAPAEPVPMTPAPAVMRAPVRFGERRGFAGGTGRPYHGVRCRLRSAASLRCSSAG